MAIRPKRLPRDPMQRAKAIGDLATGLVEPPAQTPARVSQAKRKGAAARAAKLTPEQRADIARAAASARWKKS